VPVLRLTLLGAPRLHTPQGERRLDRRPAAVLAYLALQGPTPKYRLAGLLWPASGEGGARANMRQLLHRLRKGGADLVVGDQVIALREDVACDLQQLSALDLGAALALADAPPLLAGHEHDDAPDFADWLHATREQLQALQLQALDHEAARLEAAGDPAQALALVQRRLHHDPLAEAAHRRAMRLHHLLGDRAAALAAWRRCQTVLRDELGTAPAAETVALAREIERGAELLPRPQAAVPVPLALLRPPRLVGREAAWAAMEAAWQRGQLILVTGPAGAGKTRLVEDFAAAKGRALRIEGRPGDPGVPYASVARNQRRVMALRPGLSPASPEGLPAWVWQQAARLTPELGAVAAAATAPDSGADKLRFFEGVMAVYRHCIQGLAALVVDDLHFYDDASIELSTYAIASTVPLGAGMPHHLVAYREEELSPLLTRDIERMLAQGVAVQVRLAPLGEADLQALVASLELPPAPQLPEELRRFTGGHPLFVLETVRHLHQTGQLSGRWSGRLPGSGRLVELTARRLTQLSPAALNLARAAAVLGSDFGFETVCEVVGQPPFVLAPAWQELAAAQFVNGERFIHDLLHEAVLAGLPEAVARWLHRAAAAVRERQGADPARIARHWQAAGDAAAAAPWLRRAADRSRALGLVDEACGFEREVQVQPRANSRAKSTDARRRRSRGV
jgi:DNA-binding SARP family transcriptional activator